MFNHHLLRNQMKTLVLGRQCVCDRHAAETLRPSYCLHPKPDYRSHNQINTWQTSIHSPLCNTTEGFPLHRTFPPFTTWIRPILHAEWFVRPHTLAKPLTRMHFGDTGHFKSSRVHQRGPVFCRAKYLIYRQNIQHNWIWWPVLSYRIPCRCWLIFCCCCGKFNTKSKAVE